MSSFERLFVLLDARALQSARNPSVAKPASDATSGGDHGCTLADPIPLAGMVNVVERLGLDASRTSTDPIPLAEMVNEVERLASGPTFFTIPAQAGWGRRGR
jgi:hypothetical protein